MKLPALAACLLGLSVVSAMASWHQVQTRFGVLEVVRGANEESIQFAGRPVAGPDDETPDIYHGVILGVWSIGTADVALIAYGRGGSGPCIYRYLIVRASSAGAKVTAPIGRCVGEVIEVRQIATRLEIALRAVDPRVDFVAIAYAGGNVTETEVLLLDTPAPLPGGGAEVTRWAGVHAHQIVRDPGERQRLLTIMSWEKLFELMDRMHVGRGAAIEDGWLIARGNMPHRGCVEMGGFAVEIATGRAEAAIFHKGRAPEVFGGKLGTLHPAIEQLARIGSPNCRAQ